jgi:hypothetical protein
MSGASRWSRVGVPVAVGFIVNGFVASFLMQGAEVATGFLGTPEGDDAAHQIVILGALLPFALLAGAVGGWAGGRVARRLTTLEKDRRHVARYLPMLLVALGVPTALLGLAVLTRPSPLGAPTPLVLVWGAVAIELVALALDAVVAHATVHGSSLHPAAR